MLSTQSLVLLLKKNVKKRNSGNKKFLLRMARSGHETVSSSKKDKSVLVDLVIRVHSSKKNNDPTVKVPILFIVNSEFHIVR